MDEALLGWLFPRGQLSLTLDKNEYIGVQTHIGFLMTEILQVSSTVSHSCNQLHCVSRFSTHRTTSGEMAWVITHYCQPQISLNLCRFISRLRLLLSVILSQREHWNQKAVCLTHVHCFTHLCSIQWRRLQMFITAWVGT